VKQLSQIEIIGKGEFVEFVQLVHFKPGRFEKISHFSYGTFVSSPAVEFQYKTTLYPLAVIGQFLMESPPPDRDNL
jgi:hypothetical protein